MATAESCTGGLIAAACTAVAGSSDWFERGFVTYSNEAKTELLGVDAALIAAHGAVSEPVARAMAEGALARSPRRLAVAVTGIAGPGGAVPGKPVGTVWLAWRRRGGAVHGRAPAARRRPRRGARAHRASSRCSAAALRLPPGWTRRHERAACGDFDAARARRWRRALRAAMPECSWLVRDDGAIARDASTSRWSPTRRPAACTACRSCA